MVGGPFGSPLWVVCSQRLLMAVRLARTTQARSWHTTHDSHQPAQGRIVQSAVCRKSGGQAGYSRRRRSNGSTRTRNAAPFSTSGPAPAPSLARASESVVLTPWLSLFKQTGVATPTGAAARVQLAAALGRLGVPRLGAGAGARPGRCRQRRGACFCWATRPTADPPRVTYY